MAESKHHRINKKNNKVVRAHSVWRKRKYKSKDTRQELVRKLTKEETTNE